VRNDYKWFLLGLAVAGGFLVVERLLLRVTTPIIASALAAITGCMMLLLFVRWIINGWTADRISPPAVKQMSQPDTAPPSGSVTLPPPLPRRDPAARDCVAGTNLNVLDLAGLGFHGAVTQFKRQLLADAIARSDGNRAEAARLLGLQRTYLYRLTRQLGIDRDKDPSPLVEETGSSGSIEEI
jgi:hypothetical protein